MNPTVETDDEKYTRAKNDPVANVILEALHDYDARSYNGHPTHIGALAVDAAAAVRLLAAAEERARLADLLELDANTIADFAGGKPDLIRLVAYMLRLGG